MNFKSKYIFTLCTLLFFIPQVVFSYDAVVIVLEAPLLKSPDTGSSVLQTLRKGSRVYVPNEVVVGGIIPEYVPTFDRTGNRAYIPGRFIKVILGTTAEASTPITLAGHDPTDYRLEEPIPSTYPYAEQSYLRASVSLMIGNSTKSPYAYDSSFDKQNYPSEIGTRLSLTKKVDHDKYNRFYFGLMAIIATANNSLEFKNNNQAKENRSLLRTGPWLTYDSLKNDKYRLTLGTGFTFNYHRTSLSVDAGGMSEERLFSGFSIAPMVSSNFQISDVLPYTDLVAGMDLSLFLPHSQKDSESAEFPELWGQSNQIDSGLKAQASLFLGIQVKY